MILCLLGFCFSAGCDSQQTAPGAYAQTPDPIYISKDPTACKSISVDCAIHNTEYFHWAAFSDSTGCGCKASRATY